LLVAEALPAVALFAEKLGLPIPRPIGPDQVRRAAINRESGPPSVGIALTTGYIFC